MVLWLNNFHEREKHDTLNHTQDDKYTGKHNRNIEIMRPIDFLYKKFQ